MFFCLTRIFLSQITPDNPLHELIIINKFICNSTELDSHIQYIQASKIQGYTNATLRDAQRDYKYKHLVSETSNIWEGQFIKVTDEETNTHVTIGNIFRQPRDGNENYQQFTEEFTRQLAKFQKSKGEVIIAGDYINPIYTHTLGRPRLPNGLNLDRFDVKAAQI